MTTTPTPSASELYLRQHALLDPQRAATTHINICGCGTVGSNIAVQLAKAGFGSFEMHDYDVVDVHNIPSQDFTLEDVGKSKVVVLRNRMLSLNPRARIDLSEEPLDGMEPRLMRGSVLILAVDSMDLRKELFEAALQNPEISLVMDFRMGGWVLQQWCVPTHDERSVERFQKKLYSSADVVPETCGTRTFAPVGAMSGALAVSLLTKWVMYDPASDEADDEDNGVVPFHTNFDLGLPALFTTTGVSPQ